VTMRSDTAIYSFTKTNHKQLCNKFKKLKYQPEKLLQ